MGTRDASNECWEMYHEASRAGRDGHNTTRDMCCTSDPVKSRVLMDNFNPASNFCFTTNQSRDVEDLSRDQFHKSCIAGDMSRGPMDKSRDLMCETLDLCKHMDNHERNRLKDSRDYFDESDCYTLDKSRDPIDDVFNKSCDISNTSRDPSDETCDSIETSRDYCNDSCYTSEESRDQLDVLGDSVETSRDFYKNQRHSSPSESRETTGMTRATTDESRDFKGWFDTHL